MKEQIEQERLSHRDELKMLMDTTNNLINNLEEQAIRTAKEQAHKMRAHVDQRVNSIRMTIVGGDVSAEEKQGVLKRRDRDGVWEWEGQ